MNFKTKDMIYAGGFAVVYMVVAMIASMVLGFVPILSLYSVQITIGFACGSIYFMYAMKLKKFGAITLLALLVGIMSAGTGHIYTLFFAVPVGLLADFIAKLGKYESRKMYGLSYIAFNLITVTPFFSYVTAREETIQMCVDYYGPEYGQAIDLLISDQLIPIQLGLAVVGGVLGVLFANKMLKNILKKREWYNFMNNEIVKFDPRSKLFLFLGVCVLVMHTPDWRFNFCVSTLLILLLYLSGQFKKNRVKYYILLGSYVVEYLLSLMPHSATAAILLIVVVLFKMFLPIIMAFQFVYQTTTISEFMAAFTKMKLPAVFIIPFAVMFRFIPTVNEEWTGIRQAMGFRGIGLTYKNVFLRPMQTVEYIIVPLLFSCVNVMDELVAASLARGLDSSKKRTCVAMVQFRLNDIFVVVVTAMLFGLAFIL